MPKWSVLTQQLAMSAAQSAVEQCNQDGNRISAAVVDRAGIVLAQLREYRAGPHTVDSSRRKAYTAVSLSEPTQKLALLRAKMPQIHALGDMNEQILILGGGFPIILNGEVVGATG